jgi:hypothetical protein
MISEIIVNATQVLPIGLYKKKLQTIITLENKFLINRKVYKYLDDGVIHNHKMWFQNQ